MSRRIAKIPQGGLKRIRRWESTYSFIKLLSKFDLNVFLYITKDNSIDDFIDRMEIVEKNKGMRCKA